MFTCTDGGTSAYLNVYDMSLTSLCFGHNFYQKKVKLRAFCTKEIAVLGVPELLQTVDM